MRRFRRWKQECLRVRGPLEDRRFIEWENTAYRDEPKDDKRDEPAEQEQGR